MTRTLATNFTGTLQFPYATAAADLFKKEDVQTMALAVDQHDHSTGKGLPLPGSAITNGAINLPDWYRSTALNTPFPTSGSGLEMYYDATNNIGAIQAYNRGGGTYRPLTLLGSTVTLAANNGAAAVVVGTDLSTTFNGIIRPTASGIRFASGATMVDYFSAPDAYVAVSQLTVSPGKFAAALINCNGPLTVSGSAATILSGPVTCQSSLSVTGTINATGGMGMGSGAHITWPSGGDMYDAGSGFCGILKASIQTLAITTLQGNIACTGHYLGSGIVQAGGTGVAAAGTVALTNGIGQGNGAASSLPLAKGTGFGPTSPGGVGWIMFNTGGTNIYCPYFV